MLAHRCRLKKTLFSKKYGVGPVRFTHHRNNVIYGSGKGESQEAGTIRYLSLHDNAYLRYYRGHEAPISALRLCPTDDTFVSAAPGDTVRWWDLRAMACQGVLAINGPPLVDLDPTGLVFAVALEHRLLRLFDRRAYERGPFAAFEILDRTRAAGSVNWTSLTFSPDGRELLVGTDVGLIYLIDSFDGFVKGTFSGHESISGVPSRRRHTVEPAFTPDAQYILCGSSQDFKVHMWRRDQPDKSPFAALEGHTSCPSLVRFNPRLALMASACTNLAFWQP